MKQLQEPITEAEDFLVEITYVSLKLFIKATLCFGWVQFSSYSEISKHTLSYMHMHCIYNACKYFQLKHKLIYQAKL